MDLVPISSCFSTEPDALGIEFGPTREMLHPLHISLLQKLLPPTQYISTKSGGHVTKWRCVSLHMVVEEVHHDLSVGALF